MNEPPLQLSDAVCALGRISGATAAMTLLLAGARNEIELLQDAPRMAELKARMAELVEASQVYGAWVSQVGAVLQRCVVRQEN